MKFLSAQPDSDYFIWQLEVQAHNFRKFGLEKDMLILLGFDKTKGVNPKAMKFARQTRGKVFFIGDTRQDKSYVASIRPHIIKKFYTQNRMQEPIFYHDSDIVFFDKPNFDHIINCKCENVFVSNTISYIGAKYIKSKSEKLLDEMCAIVGISKEVVVRNENRSGGAQYFFKKPVDKFFWEKVENDSIKLYNHLKSTENVYSPEHPIQSWCADMWAVLWNIWLLGKNTSIKPELNFKFATELVSEIGETKILHNAGVTDKNWDYLFYKGKYYDKTPYDEDFSYVDPKYVSSLYVKEIVETGIYKKTMRL